MRSQLVAILWISWNNLVVRRYHKLQFSTTHHANFACSPWEPTIHITGLHASCNLSLHTYMQITPQPTSMQEEPRHWPTSYSALHRMKANEGKKWRLGVREERGLILYGWSPQIPGGWIPSLDRRTSPASPAMIWVAAPFSHLSCWTCRTEIKARKEAGQVT